MASTSSPRSSSSGSRRRSRRPPAPGPSQAHGRRSGSRRVARPSRPAGADGAGASAGGRVATRGVRPTAPSHPAVASRPPIRLAAAVVALVAALALAAAVVALVLSRTSAFTISGIDATASEHVSADQIARLAAVPDGTTLLSVDVSKVADNVRKSPWVKDVSVTREFPDRLGISVTERAVAAIVVVGTGGQGVWALGEDGVWIEPVQLSVPDGGDVTQAALAKASELGCLLITQVPSSVDPTQGSQVTDETVLGVLEYDRELSEDFSSQVAMYTAASTGSISCVLDSGLEVSLGSPTDISAKQSAIDQIMSKYPGQLTYINVRVPSKPLYRKVQESSLAAGTGIRPSATDSAATSAATAGAATAAATTDKAADKSSSGE